MRSRFALALGAVLALTGCPGPQIPFVRLAGFVVPPRATGQPTLVNARIDVLALEGHLGKVDAARAAAVEGSPGLFSFSVNLDAGLLPADPAPFKVVLINPESPPRDGALLSGVVLLSRPRGTGPDLGMVRLDLDATSSLAALALEYRANLSEDRRLPAGIDPQKVAQRLDKSLIEVNFIQAYGAFVQGGRNDAPAASLELAQQASEELPADLTQL